MKLSNLIGGMLLACWAVHSVSIAHEDHVPVALSAAEKSQQHAFGKVGDPTKVSRIVHITMVDSMRFTPDLIQVKLGETIQLVLHNDGKVLHEFVLGNKEQLKQHAEAMRKLPDMVHQTAYMAHVQPGRTKSIIWQFNRGGTFDFACLIAGHFEAGMVGQVKVEAI